MQPLVDRPPILVVLHDGELGGATRAILPALRELGKRGWQFVFWVPGVGPARDQLEREGFRTFGRARPFRYSWGSLQEPPGVIRRALAVPGYLSRFRACLRSVSPGIVHANTLLTMPEAIVARLAGAPTLVYAHEMLPAGPKGRVAAALTRRSADTVIAVSHASADALRRAGVDADVVYVGVRAMAPRPPGRRRRRIVVGTVGTVSARKGSDVFVDAARKLAAETDELELRIVGAAAPGREESWANALIERAKRAGISHREAVEDIFEELESWDIFVLPSREDPFPLTVLEAMAAGLPVVASAVDGIREQVTPTTGVLVHPDDADALAGAIRALAARKDGREELGAHARRRVLQSFPLERQVDGLDGAYRRLADRGSAHPRLRLHGRLSG